MTSTINPSSPPPKAEIKPPARQGNSATYIWVIAISLVVCLGLAAFLAMRGDSGHSEETRAKAEAVLKARFNDTNPGVGPLKSLSVTWKGDQLVATWTQGENAQKRCTAPVLVSPDGQSFGIAAFQAVPFDKQDSAPATCVSTEGLQYGLPLSG